MSISIDRLSKQQLIFFSMILMLVSLFTSRFLLSVGFILFLFFTCFHKNFFQQLISFLRTPFLLAMSLLFLIPFLSWFWTSDKEMWMHFVRIKFPLFLFPIAFAGNWQLSSKQWEWVSYSFLILVFAGCCWSLLQYAQNAHSIDEQYLKAKIFSTPLQNDHVRFSLLVCIAVVCMVIVMLKYVPKSKWIVPLFACIFLVVYLHVLSARTGLVSLYIFLVLSLLYLLFKLRNARWVIGLVVLVAAMPVIAWFLFPTFQNRIRYNIYDLSNARENKYVQGSNDGNRILSLKAGWKLLQKHPFGTGADVVEETYKWYDQHIPRMVNTDKLYPASEPLMYAGFAGWIGFVTFFIIMLLPFFERIKRNYFFWFVLNLIMAFSFLFDIGLEVQFGVFIYAFVVLWWWKWLSIFEWNRRYKS